MDVRTYDTVGELPAADWDSLTSGSTIYSTAGFQGVREEELPQGAQARRITAHDAGGTVAAYLEAYAFTRPPTRSTPPPICSPDSSTRSATPPSPRARWRSGRAGPSSGARSSTTRTPGPSSGRRPSRP